MCDFKNTLSVCPDHIFSTEDIFHREWFYGEKNMMVYLIPCDVLSVMVYRQEQEIIGEIR